MKTVLFLDIDGVLNSASSNDLLADNLLRNLKKIVDAIRCEIVLTSTWRLYSDSLKTLKKAFDDHKIPKWIGKTPDLCGERWTEIQEWISKKNIGNYKIVVIDDDKDADIPTPPKNYYFFQTDFLTGLNDSVANNILLSLRANS